MIGAHRRQNRAPDEISLVLGSPHFATPYYDDLLRSAVLGPYSRDRVPVSRFYMLLHPPVVVDFESHPADGPLYLEEKQRHFTAKGVVYVPIFLGETLTAGEFAERVRQARKFAEQAAKLHKEDESLRGVVVPLGLPLRVPVTEIDREALAILAKDVEENVHLRGGSRARRLAAIKRQLLAAHTGETVHMSTCASQARYQPRPQPARAKGVPELRTRTPPRPDRSATAMSGSATSRE